jgi:hypothetical protein
MPVAPHVRSQAAFFDKAARLIRTNRAGVIPVYLQPNFAHVAQPESVIEQQGNGLATVSLRPVILIADGDTQLACLVDLVGVKQRTLTDLLAVGFNRERCTVSPACAGILVELCL